MAKRRELKKNVNYIAGELLTGEQNGSPSAPVGESDSQTLR